MPFERGAMIDMGTYPRAYDVARPTGCIVQGVREPSWAGRRTQQYNAASTRKQ